SRVEIWAGSGCVPPISPLPICPNELLPQLQTVPSDLRTNESIRPPDALLALLRPLTCDGKGRICAVSLFPSSLLLLAPQLQTLPPESTNRPNLALTGPPGLHFPAAPDAKIS